MQSDCCILNAGGGAWAFEPLARQLSRALWVDVADTPRKYNYLLLADDALAEELDELFIPYASMVLAADKRELARVFAAAGVPTPETLLVDSLDEAQAIASARPQTAWCLKFPIGCGASGHRMLTLDTTLPRDWPRPLVVQEFVRLERPEVYRLFGAGGRLFGWVARRFPAGVRPSPWVAHVRGARYELTGQPPSEAVSAVRAALEVTGLIDSFGCADLIQRPTGEWVVLEIGTDGLFNHVDRDLGLPDLEQEIQRQIAEAFWQRLGHWRPWGNGPWRPRPSEQ